MSANFFYFYVKNATGLKTDGDIPDLYVGGETFQSDFQKALVLSDQYKSVYNVCNNIMPLCEQSMPLNSFAEITVNDDDILKAIREMNYNSACGADEVSGQFIRNLSCYLVKPLKLLIHKSFLTGIVPLLWRLGIIIPIYKNNRKPHEPASYRPVCLTCIPAKLAERVLVSKLLPYLIENGGVSINQHAFIEKKSTLTNLLECLNDWTQAVDGNIPIDNLYIDLAKAFDSVPLEKLLFKLKKFGIGGTILL